MESTGYIDRVKELADEVARSEGCLLYDLEFVGKGKNRTLRVFIDKEQGAVDVNNCAKVSHGLEALLDSEDVVPGDEPYQLEVSSPGLERVLKVPWQYKLVLGQKIWLKLSQNLQEQGIEVGKFKTSKVITGELIECDDQQIQVSLDGQNVSLPFEKIEKAKTIFDFGGQSRGSTKR